MSKIMQRFLLLFLGILMIKECTGKNWNWNDINNNVISRELLKFREKVEDNTDLLESLKDVGIKIEGTSSESDITPYSWTITIKNATALLPFLDVEQMQIRITGEEKAEVTEISIRDLTRGKELGRLKFTDWGNWTTQLEIFAMQSGNKFSREGFKLVYKQEALKHMVEASNVNKQGENFQLLFDLDIGAPISTQLSTKVKYNEREYNFAGKYFDKGDQTLLDLSLNGEDLLVSVDWKGDFEEWANGANISVKAGGLNYKLGFVSGFDLNDAVVSLYDGKGLLGKGEFVYDLYNFEFSFSGNFEKKGKSCEITMKSEGYMGLQTFVTSCEGVKEWEGYLNKEINNWNRDHPAKLAYKFNLKHRDVEYADGHFDIDLQSVVFDFGLELPRLSKDHITVNSRFSLLDQKFDAAISRNRNIKAEYGIRLHGFLFPTFPLDLSLHLGTIGKIDANLVCEPNTVNSEVKYNGRNIFHFKLKDTYGIIFPDEDDGEFNYMLKIRETVISSLSVSSTSPFSPAPGQVQYSFDQLLGEATLHSHGTLRTEGAAIVIECKKMNHLPLLQGQLESTKLEITGEDGVDGKNSLKFDIYLSTNTGENKHFSSTIRNTEPNSFELKFYLDQYGNINSEVKLLPGDELQCVGTASILNSEYKIQSSFDILKSSVKIMKDGSIFFNADLVMVSPIDKWYLDYHVEDIRSGRLEINADDAEGSLSIEDFPKAGKGWRYNFVQKFEGSKSGLGIPTLDNMIAYELKIGDKVDSSYNLASYHQQLENSENFNQTTKFFVDSSSFLYPLICIDGCINSRNSALSGTSTSGMKYAKVDYIELQDDVPQLEAGYDLMSSPTTYYLRFPPTVARLIKMRQLNLEIDQEFIKFLQDLDDYDY